MRNFKRYFMRFNLMALVGFYALALFISPTAYAADSRDDVLKQRANEAVANLLAKKNAMAERSNAQAAKAAREAELAAAAEEKALAEAQRRIEEATRKLEMGEKMKAPAKVMEEDVVEANSMVEKSLADSEAAGDIVPELAPEGVYTIQVGDRVKITIYPADNYIKGGEMEVSSEGNVTLPLMGKISVAGKSAIQAEREIAEILDRDYLVDPEVVLEVTEKFAAEEEKTIVLLGQVKSPGTYPFPKGERFTLLQALALAGGFSDVANIKKIKIVRGNEEQSQVIRANAENIIAGKDPDIELINGDIIHVTESLF